LRFHQADILGGPFNYLSQIKISFLLPGKIKMFPDYLGGLREPAILSTALTVNSISSATLR